MDAESWWRPAAGAAGELGGFNHNARMSSRWWTLALWALVAASALFWGLKIFARPPAMPAHTQVAELGGVSRGDLTRLLGADAPPPSTAPAPAADARFQLIGVVTPRPQQAAREGLALIAVDGKPAKVYRVGAVVDGQTVLKAVAARGATLGPRDGTAVLALAIAPPPPAATGVLPANGVPPLNGAQSANGVPHTVLPMATPPLPPTTAPPGTPRGSRLRPTGSQDGPSPGAPSQEGLQTQ
jgi:general secretion pathway protein C